MPDAHFRHVLAIDDRAFGTLEDGRVVEIVLRLERTRSIARHWIYRARSAGLGSGATLALNGAVSGNGLLAFAGVAAGALSFALPLALPAYGFEVYLDYAVIHLGGGDPFVTESVVTQAGQVTDLEIARGREHHTLSEFVAQNLDCAHFIATGTLARPIQ